MINNNDFSDIINKYKEDHAKEIAEKFYTSMEGIGFNKEEAIEYLKNIGGNE